MQRGAYEAMSMGKPVIVSDWPVLKDTFYKGAVYVGNEEEKIREGILNMMADRRRLDQEILELREERSKIFQERISALRELIAKAR
jgi:glycosyltransferase involved in cell wall biosynthesis